MSLAAQRTEPGLDIFDLARSGAFEEGLQALAVNVTGRAGYLALKGTALAAGGPGATILAGRAELPAGQLDEVFDPVLAAFGLRLLKGAEAGGGEMACPRLPALYLRLGLLARSLDMAYRHLKPRSSFGQQVMKHQLVRADIARANNQLHRILSECALVEKGQGARRADLDDCLMAHHATVSCLFTAVTKLMGGHGYLLSGNAPLEYLSSLVFAIYAEPAAEVRQPAIPVGAEGRRQMEDSVA